MDHETYPDDTLRDVLTSVRSLAVVGLSPNWNRPSYFVAKYLQGKGYRILPVNPGAAGQTILGAPCVAALADLAEVPDMVDVFRNSEAAGPIADEAIRIGATVVWMQIGVRNDAAAARAEAAGLRVIMNRCPKIEYSRLFGELGWQGIDTGIVTTKRRPVKPARPLM